MASGPSAWRDSQEKSDGGEATRAHPNQVCVFGRVVENLDGFAVMCKRLRYEGTKPMTTRRAEQRPHAVGRAATG